MQARLGNPDANAGGSGFALHCITLHIVGDPNARPPVCLINRLHCRCTPACILPAAHEQRFTRAHQCSPDRLQILNAGPNDPPNHAWSGCSAKPSAVRQSASCCPPSSCCTHAAPPSVACCWPTACACTAELPASSCCCCCSGCCCCCCCSGCCYCCAACPPSALGRRQKCRMVRTSSSALRCSAIRASKPAASMSRMSSARRGVHSVDNECMQCLLFLVAQSTAGMEQQAQCRQHMYSSSLCPHNICQGVPHQPCLSTPTHANGTHSRSPGGSFSCTATRNASPRGDSRRGSSGSNRSVTRRPRAPPAHAAAMPPLLTSSSGVGT